MAAAVALLRRCQRRLRQRAQPDRAGLAKRKRAGALLSDIGLYPHRFGSNQGENGVAGPHPRSCFGMARDDHRVIGCGQPMTREKDLLLLQGRRRSRARGEAETLSSGRMASMVTSWPVRPVPPVVMMTSTSPRAVQSRTTWRMARMASWTFVRADSEWPAPATRVAAPPSRTG